MSLLVESTWREFADAGLFWWINRGLHLFGWALVYIENKDGTIERVYPARTTYRGFSEETEREGFRQLSQHMRDNLKDGT